jgi:hypothetical protein
MPRDVQTRWNSTSDMLNFALKYRKAVESMTQIKDLGLRKYELEPEEWVLAQQLADVLEVCQTAVNMGLQQQTVMRRLLLRAFSVSYHA